IVVEKSRGVNELHQRGEQIMRRAFVAASPRNHQHQCRAQPFAAGIDDVLAKSLDKHDVGVETRSYQRIDGSHLGLNRGQDRLNVHGWTVRKTAAKLGARRHTVKRRSTWNAANGCVDRENKSKY